MLDNPNQILRDFTGKNVLITGGSRGIGRSCAKIFSNLNANVIITYKSGLADAEQTLNLLSSNQNHSLYQLDIARPDDVKQLFQQVIEV